MKISILITEHAKQIMFTPETEHEKKALKFIQPEETLVAVTRWQTFSEVKEIVGVSVGKSVGGGYRAYEDKESLMFIIEKEEKKEPTLYPTGGSGGSSPFPHSPLPDAYDGPGSSALITPVAGTSKGTASLIP
jgi:hypothetical protein